MLINFKLMVAKAFLFSATVLLLSAPSVFSQRFSHAGPHHPLHPPLVTWIIASSEDSVTVCAAYSLQFRRLVFVKGDGTPETFDAELSFSVDATDSISGTNYHGYHRKKLSLRSFSTTRKPRLSCQDFVLLTVARSTYRLRAEVRDDNQQIKYLDYSATEELNPSSRLGIISTVFIDSLSGTSYFPEMGKDEAPFPENIKAAVLIRDGGDAPLTAVLKRSDGKIVSRVDSLAPSQSRLEPDRSGYVISFTKNPDSDYSTYFARFDSDSLREGRYILEVSSGKVNEKIAFSYLWLTKPVTLRDFEMALSLLRYIAPDSVYSSINSGSTKEKKERFESYWKSHDPTPNTAYNELEDEYYKRADYAVEHFQTVVNENGAETDRGKAYILYGQPESVKREFLNDGTYEFWYYPGLKSALVFKEERFGEFKLYRTEKL